MNFEGIIVGASVFLIIGLCHPVTIKLEYHFGKKGAWFFAVAGLICTAASLFIMNHTVSTILAAFAFSCFWGIREVFQQEKRVMRGWFPENPARHDHYENLRKKFNRK